MGLNLYASLAQLKAALAISSVTDEALLTACLRNASRLIDQATKRTFFPELATRFVDGSGSDRLWLPQPLLEAREVALSGDGGRTYTALADDDWWASNGQQWGVTPFQLLVLAPSGRYGSWWRGPRTVRITGWWGWRPDYAGAWEDAADAVQDASLSAVATQVTVTNSAGADALGLTPRFSAGNLIRIDDEVCEVTGTTSTKLTVTRGQNGTTAATHAQGAAITRWRPFEPVEQASLTQAARFFKRAQQAYADAGASVELGRLVFAKRLDPDVEVILVEGGLRRVTVG